MYFRPEERFVSRARIARFAVSYRELLLVLLAAGAGLMAHRPLRWIGAHQGINVLLAALVFSSAITVARGAFGHLQAGWWRIVVALVAGVAVLPALSWLAAQIVTAGPLRDGVMTIGLAPSEIAAVAVTAMAGGESIIATAMLVCSTVVCVALAGPILAAEAGQAGVAPGPIVVNLVVVVAVPLAAGLALRRRWPLTGRQRAEAGTAGALFLAGLVALVAAQVDLGAAYLGVLVAVAIFLVGSVLLGSVLGRRAPREQAIAVLLTISMRDFAIAAALASSAFGAAAAAPLGVYGVVVIGWGTAAGGTLRRRAARVVDGR